MYKDYFKGQRKLIDKHLSKAEQCMEYRKYDDARVHISIASILCLRQPTWDEVDAYEQESLNNLASALAN